MTVCHSTLISDPNFVSKNKILVATWKLFNVDLKSADKNLESGKTDTFLCTFLLRIYNYLIGIKSNYRPDLCIFYVVTTRVVTIEKQGADHGCALKQIA